MTNETTDLVADLRAYGRGDPLMIRAADEIERLRAALTLQASPFILKTLQEKEINWERVMREVNRRQKLAKDALS